MESSINKFVIPGVVEIDDNENGLLRVNISSEACTAELYLQGAHLTRWHPVGHEPVLFLSERSLYQPGKAIRGGVPIIFPWFGARTANAQSARTDGPSHGFARTAVWQLDSATVDGGNVHIALSLEPNDAMRALGYDHFRAVYKMIIGADLQLQLIIENRGQEVFVFEEAFHSYFAVGDASKVSITGLADTDFLDKTDGFKRKNQQDAVLTLTGETDRPYLDTESSVVLEDPVLKRRVTVGKLNSKTTIIWNPWAELSAKLSDMSPDGWQHMTCIETANVAYDRVTLAPGAQHIMSAYITVARFSI